MLNLNFYSFGEQKPAIGLEIIYLRKGMSYGMTYFEPHEATVEGQWTQLEDGEYSGSSACYDIEDPEPPDPYTEDGVDVTFRLDINIDGYIIDEKCDNWYWMPLEQYWAAFDAAEGNVEKEVDKLEF